MHHNMRSFEKHIQNPIKKGFSICGEKLQNEFFFQGLNHAFANALQKGRLLPCPKCKSKVIKELNSQK